MGHLVDYSVAAGRYHQHRALTPAAMARWQAAVAARLPSEPVRRVVDVGAGTGMFVPMWRALGAAVVVAAEPSAAMRAQLVERASHVVAATADAVPVTSGSVDAVWASAMLHHVPDLPAALAELRRVLRPGGVVLVRGFLGDVEDVPWLPYLPGHEAAAARFPSVATLAELLGDDVTVTVDDVAERDDITGAAAADWIVTMRDADSLLTGIDDAGIAVGVAALRALGDAVLPPQRLKLLTAVG